MDYNLTVVLFANLIIIVAFYIRSLSGIGSALISIPLLSLFFDIKFVIPLEALFEVMFSLMLISKVYKDIRLATLKSLSIGVIFGSLVGVFLLNSLASVILKRTLGVVVILSAITLLFNIRTANREPSMKYGLLAGASSGVLGGLFGTSGPPITWYLSYVLKEKNVLRASLIGIFTIDFLWRVSLYASTGLLTMEMLKTALFLTPALVIGTVFGHRTHTQISDIRFKQIVSSLLIASGLLLLIR